MFRRKKDKSSIAIKLMSATFESKTKENNNSKKTKASKARQLSIYDCRTPGWG